MKKKRKDRKFDKYGKCINQTTIVLLNKSNISFNQKKNLKNCNKKPSNH